MPSRRRPPGWARERLFRRPAALGRPAPPGDLPGDSDGDEGVAAAVGQEVLLRLRTLLDREVRAIADE